MKIETLHVTLAIELADGAEIWAGAEARIEPGIESIVQRTLVAEGVDCLGVCATVRREN